MKRKHITAAVLSALLVASSAVTAFAAPYDFFQVSLSKTHSILDVATKTSVVLDVATKPSDFTIELKDGKKYPLADYIKVMKDNPTFTEDQAIEELNKMGLKVVSVSAISPKEIKVEFNKAISAEDQAKVNFEVKKGSSAIAVTAKWAEGGMSATLEKATKFAVGNYTVKASGLEFAPNGDGGSVEIKEEEATAIVIKSESLDKKANAPFVFEVQNQYNKAMTPAPAVTVVLLNKTEAGRVATYVPPAAINTMATEFGDEIQATIFVTAKPEIKAVKTLKVTGQVIDKIEFGAGKLEEGETVLLPGKKITVPVKAFAGSNPKNLSNDVGYTNGVVIAADDLIPIWNDKEIAAAAFDGAKQELTLTVAAATKPGEKTFNYVTSGGDILPFKFEVVSAASLELKEAAPEQVQNGKTVKVPFKVMLSDGSEAKPGVMTGYTVKVTEKVDGKVNVMSPINGATILDPQDITGVAVGKETLTYQLFDNENKEVGAPVVFDIEVVAPIATIEVKTDKTDYKAGEDIVLTIQAKVGGNNVDYSVEMKNQEILIDPAGLKLKYFRDVNFVGGVATIKVPATKELNTKVVQVRLDGGLTDNSDNITVVAGEVTKFKVEDASAGGKGKITITAQDKYDNTVQAFAGKKFITVTAEVADTGAPVVLDQLSAENQIEATFANGVQTDLLVNDGAEIVAGTKVKVVFESISGEFIK